jgi:hypothetical protein
MNSNPIESAKSLEKDDFKGMIGKDLKALFDEKLKSCEEPTKETLNEEVILLFEKYLNKSRQEDQEKIAKLEKEISIMKGETLKNDVANTLAYVNDDISVDFVCDEIYLSGYRPATEKGILTQYNIKYILTVGKELPPVFPDEFIYKKIPIYDSEHIKINKYFDECFEFINSAKGNNLLIHCGAGMSRSASILIAYLIYSKKIPYSEALRLVKSKRAIVKPNQGFEKILRNYSFELTKQF